MLRKFRRKSKDAELLIAKGCGYSMNCKKTQLNNNVLVVGSSGCGKTRSIVSPNIEQCKDSYVILDPKGNLYDMHKDKLEHEGYLVKKIDFIHPEKSDYYNPLAYIHDPMDLRSMAHNFVCCDEGASHDDRYWTDSAENLLTILLAYIHYEAPEEEQNLDTLFDIMSAMEFREDDEGFKDPVDLLFEEYENAKGSNWITRGYSAFKNNHVRTAQCVFNSAFAPISKYNTPELLKMMAWNDVEIEKAGDRKTAIFVVVSDCDRTMDILVSTFFMQAIRELVMRADNLYRGELPVAVRFIMDDFATNVRIADFPKMISAFRSRRISSMLILQSEAQLESSYGRDAQTIITNCDTYVYLGGTDIETAKNISVRTGKSVKDILYMPIGSVWVFRRGSKPVYTLQNNPFIPVRDFETEDDLDWLDCEAMDDLDDLDDEILDRYLKKYYGEEEDDEQDAMYCGEAVGCNEHCESA